MIYIATVFYKPQNNKTDIAPKFYCSITDQWVIFPHELEGLTCEEIAKSKGENIAKLIQKSLTVTKSDINL